MSYVARHCDVLQQMQIEFILYYINKILNIRMIQESFQIQPKREYMDSESAKKFFSKKQDQLTGLSSKQQKLLRNKISAKNCREKKKNYVKELEQNEKMLQQEIKNVDEQLQKTKLKLNNFMSKYKSNDSFNHDQRPTYQRLKLLIRQEGEFDQDQANMLIQLLINRVGVTGRQRKRMVQYYSNRLFNFSIPAIYRYLLITSTEQTGFFQAEDVKIEEQQWHEPLIRQLNLSEEKRKQIATIRGLLLTQKKQWSDKIFEFRKIKQKIYNLSSQVEEQLLPLREQISVKQCGQVIIAIQNRKYNKQTYYGSQDDKENPDIERLTKKVKLN